ncbi:hypothetical protein RZS08_37155, partial [Arthrospira platensis SPKY1]|nr:hypothetical protein [Arthrospira platensis SPKY1]
AFLDDQQAWYQDRNQLELLEADLRRKTSLNQEQVASERALQEAKAQVEQLRAQVLAGELRLKQWGFDTQGIAQGRFTQNLPIRAPADGVITRVRVSNGQFAEPTQAI